MAASRLPPLLLLHFTVYTHKFQAGMPPAPRQSFPGLPPKLIHIILRPEVRHKSLSAPDMQAISPHSAAVMCGTLLLFLSADSSPGPAEENLPL
jgi:hypothetical protein